MTPHILIACIGNIFLGDDGFGVEVARRLLGRPHPPGTRVVDFGIRGFDLALALLDGATDAVILVDAVPRGGEPGTLYVIEPDQDCTLPAESAEALPIEMHSLDPVKVLRLARAMGGGPKPVVVVGCEPVPLGPDDDPPFELSAPVQAAVDEAIVLIETLVARRQRGDNWADANQSETAISTRETINHASP